MNDIDARIASRSFVERGTQQEVNYSKFLADLENRVKLGNLNQNTGKPG